MATETKKLTSAPSILPLYARAAMPLVPGASLLPFVPGGGGEIPDVRLELDGVVADPDAVAAYAKVCGFALRDHLPPTYPHVLAFPLHMALMSDGSFPFGAVGLVHVANKITQHRRIGVDEALDLRVQATKLVAASRKARRSTSSPRCASVARSPGRAPAPSCGAARAIPGPPPARRSRSSTRTSRRAPNGASTATSAAATGPSPATATRSTCTR